MNEEDENKINFMVIKLPDNGQLISLNLHKDIKLEKEFRIDYTNSIFKGVRTKFIYSKLKNSLDDIFLEEMMKRVKNVNQYMAHFISSLIKPKEKPTKDSISKLISDNLEPVQKIYNSTIEILNNVILEIPISNLLHSKLQNSIKRLIDLKATLLKMNCNEFKISGKRITQFMTDHFHLCDDCCSVQDEISKDNNALFNKNLYKCNIEECNIKLSQNDFYKRIGHFVVLYERIRINGIICLGCGKKIKKGKKTCKNCEEHFKDDSSREKSEVSHEKDCLMKTINKYKKDIKSLSSSIICDCKSNTNKEPIDPLKIKFFGN